MNEPFLDPTGWYGFVYLITDTVTGRRYVGRKYFWRMLRGKGKRRKRTESDWRNYYGSSLSLKGDVETNGTSRYRREILSLHKTKGAVNYSEVKEQFDRDVLNDESYYNDSVAKFVNVNLKESIFS